MDAHILHELFEYRDGVLYWKSKSSRNIKIGDKVGSISSGYLHTRIKGKIFPNHRIIFAMHYGYFPKFVDHKDGNKLNNKIDNLRDASSAENAHNAKLSKKNTSGEKGVCLSKQTGKWHVRIQLNGVRKSLGHYDNFEDAVIVCRKERIKMHGEFARHE